MHSNKVLMKILVSKNVFILAIKWTALWHTRTLCACFFEWGLLIYCAVLIAIWKLFVSDRYSIYLYQPTWEITTGLGPDFCVKKKKQTKKISSCLQLISQKSQITLQVPLHLPRYTWQFEVVLLFFSRDLSWSVSVLTLKSLNAMLSVSKLHFLNVQTGKDKLNSNCCEVSSSALIAPTTSC